MTLADIGIYGEELYEQTLPMHGPDPDGLAHDLIGAFVHGALLIDELARDDDQGRPGWGVILDVADCPPIGLPWLAQIAGVTLRAPRLITVYNLVNYNAPQFGSFENASDAALWAYPRSATTRVSGGTYGEFMGHVRCTSNGTSGSGYTSPAAPDTDYTLSVDIVSCSRAVALQVQFDNFDGSTTYATVTGPASTTLGRRSLTVKSPSDVGVETMGFRVIMASAVTNETFEMDAFAVTTDGSTSYFDGLSSTRLETIDEWAAYARDAILRQGGKNRGSLDAIRSAVEDTLTGTKSVVILERVGGDAYAMTVVTRPSETPNPDLTLTVLQGHPPAYSDGCVPAGIIVTHALTEGAIIDEGTVTIDSATGTIDTATIDDIT